MRKCLKFTLSLLLLLSGCQKESVIDFSELNNELPYISEEGFDINHVLSSVEYDKENIFENLVDVYEYDYETLGISPKNTIQGVVRVSPTSAQMYMVFKPADGKEKKLIKELEALLIQKKQTASGEDVQLIENALIEHNDDFIALIVSSDNQEVLNRIQNSKNTLFGALTLATDEDLPTYGLSTEMVDEYVIQKPLLTSARTYMIVKPRKGMEEEVKKALEAYLVNLKTQFITMPNEEKLISKALVTELEGYQIIIISKNNKTVLEMITTYLDK